LGKMKNLVMEICEMYDYQGMSIYEIARAMDMTDDEVYQVVSQYSESFNLASY